MIACRHAQLNITAHTSLSCGLTLEGCGDARVRRLRLAVHADRQTQPEDVVTVLVEWRVVVAVLGLVVAWQTSTFMTELNYWLCMLCMYMYMYAVAFGD